MRPEIGANLAIGQIEFGALHRGLVGIDRRFGCIDGGQRGARRCVSRVGARLRLVVDRVRRQPALVQLGLPLGIALREACGGFVARERGLGLRDLRLVPLHRRLRLPQRVVVWPRIDLEQKIALGHVLPFGEVHRHQFARHLRFGLHNGRGLHRSHHLELGGNRFLHNLAHRHRHHRHSRHAARPSRLLLAARQRQTHGQPQQSFIH